MKFISTIDSTKLSEILRPLSGKDRTALLSLVAGLSPALYVRNNNAVEVASHWDNVYRLDLYQTIRKLQSTMVLSFEQINSGARAVYIERNQCNLETNISIALQGVNKDTDRDNMVAAFLTIMNNKEHTDLFTAVLSKVGNNGTMQRIGYDVNLSTDTPSSEAMYQRIWGRVYAAGQMIITGNPGRIEPEQYKRYIRELFYPHIYNAIELESATDTVAIKSGELKWR